MKRIKEIKVAVLAECEAICPNQGDRKYFDWGYVYRWDDSWSLNYVSDGTCIFRTGDKNLYPRLQNWHLAYAILGLSGREAVADEKARLLKRYKSRIKRLRADDAETHKVQIEVKNERIAALETKNAALVAALEEIKNDNKLRPYETFHDLACRMAEVAKNALAANEKGGVQG